MRDSCHASIVAPQEAEVPLDDKSNIKKKSIEFAKPPVQSERVAMFAHESQRGDEDVSQMRYSPVPSQNI